MCYQWSACLYGRRYDCICSVIGLAFGTNACMVWWLSGLGHKSA
jgi:hypothetical protein